MSNSRSQFAEFDDQRIQDFEASWLNGNPKPIQELLPPASDSRYLGTLEEIVHIDLEFRWKEYNNSRSSRPPSVEEYIQQFPALDSVKLGLIQGEFDLANRFGADVSIDDFVSRFGDSVSGSDLRPILQSQLSEIKRSRQIKPGETLGRYEIVNEHGRGGFGAVWRATDTKLGRRIAVKQLGQRLANDAESRRRFISEARVTARLEHPGIVPVYDISNVQDDHAYYTMRLIQGRTMAEAIDDLHQMEPRSNEFRLLRQRLLQSFADVCLTIQYAHAQGVIHRDLKPQNIIVGDYGETILLDWGLASVIDEPENSEVVDTIGADPEVLSKEESMKTLQGSILGTPAYMSPEQARGEVDQITRLSDVYSLGATLYHIITGEIPYTDRPLDQILDRVKIGDCHPACELNSQVEKPLSCIAKRAMSTIPSNRYTGVAALVDDVQKFLADQPVSAYRDPLLARTARWIRKNPTMAAALAMSTLFVFLAGISGLMIYNAWTTREEKRITDLQIAAERGDATALSQIKTGRFDAATRTLGQALELVKYEPRLSELAERIGEREQRTQQIVDFYSLGMKAQEETFFDRTNRAAIYCQSALDELEILEHPSWWNHLPDTDLSPLQKEQLRSEVYRVTTLLASMRLAETADGTASLKVLVDPKSLPPNDPATNSIKAASFAANVANGYRQSRAMQMIEEIGTVADGEKRAINLTNINPLNAVDSAVMGSILDNNIPTEGFVRNAISGLLEMRNPNVVAKQWLDDALKFNPDWYWLPVFMGQSQVRTGVPESGIRTLSHAVGIRPDYWVGYQYRALASVAAAVQEKSRKRKAALLNSASRDIQRAMDLEPYNSELFWTKAIIQYQSGANVDQITDTFLTAFELHPSLGEISGNHYSAVSKIFYSRAQNFVDWQKTEGNITAELSLLEMAIQLWQGKLDEAEKLSEIANEKFPSHQDLTAFSQLISNQKTPTTAKPIEFQATSHFAWRYLLSNAAFHRASNEFDKEHQALTQADELVHVEWQISRTWTLLTCCEIQRGNVQDAAQLIRDTIQLDRAVNLTIVEETANTNQAESVLKICRDYRQLIKPKLKFEKQNSIEQPALLNAGFELGLSYHWAPYTRRTTAASWNNHGQSKTAAEAVSEDAKQGNRCLRLDLTCPVETDSYGQMTQSIPVTPGQEYELTFWAKAKNLTENGVQVGISNNKLTQLTDSQTIDSGDYDWKQYRLAFTSKTPNANVSIRAQGTGQAWLDNIQIRAIPDSN